MHEATYMLGIDFRDVSGGLRTQGVHPVKFGSTNWFTFSEKLRVFHDAQAGCGKPSMQFSILILFVSFQLFKLFCRRCAAILCQDSIFGN